MAIEITTKLRVLRFVYGKPEVVEAQIDSMLGDYKVLQYSYYVVKDELVMGVTMIRKDQVAQPQIARPDNRFMQ